MTCKCLDIIAMTSLTYLDSLANQLDRRPERATAEILLAVGLDGWNEFVVDLSVCYKPLAVIGISAWLGVWSICLLGLYTVRRIFLHRPQSRLSSLPAQDVPGVSIIRPLRGLDPNLYHNLASTLTLDYPKERFEVLFCVQTPTDQALDVVHELLSRYPDVNARIVIGKEGQELGVNPKINNLREGFEQAKWDIIWVLDATISVVPATLSRSVEALLAGSRTGIATAETMSGSKEQSPLLDANVEETQDRPDGRPSQSPEDRLGRAAETSGVGLVHHVPFAWLSDKSLGARLEMAYLNSTHAKMYLAINAAALESCIVGKSNLYRKSSIAQLHAPVAPTSMDASLPPPTGLAAFAPFLPEDNLIGLAIMHQLRLAHRTTPDLALDCLGQISVGAYISRRVRWIRVRKRMTPLIATLGEPFTESLLLGAIAATSARALFGFPPMLFFVLHEVAWLCTDLSVMSTLKGEGLHGAEWAEFLVAWVFRELLALPIWLIAITGEVVVWRGVRYRIIKSGEAIKVD